MPDDSDKLIIDNSGSDVTSIDFLIIEIGILSTTGALPSLKKLFVVEQSSSKITEVNFVSS